ncbi:MAG: TetR/AcrR family transcriptional regulator [Roseicyclus sp.]|nr:TetR/AcrR family transcriptional regulator [Roseicyclus sp.]
MTRPPRQSTDSWIKAAFRALSSGGLGAIKAERLARDIGVSKGSFYWHFKDVSALTAAMISHWEEAATHDVIRVLETGGGTPTARLHRLVEVATSDVAAPYGGAASEIAIRAWGRLDPAVARAVANVDAARLTYLAALFAEVGIAAPDMAARILYGASLGLEQLAQPNATTRTTDLSALLSALLDGDITGP